MEWPPNVSGIYYCDDAVCIIHGDCRDILPQLPQVDLVLTDPPYGINGHMSGMKRLHGMTKYYTSAFEDTDTYLRDVVVPVIHMLIEAVPAVVLTPGNQHFNLYPQPHSFGVFYQPCAVAVQTFGNLDAQPIFYYGKNPLGRNMGIPCSYVLTEIPGPSEHPCPKPLGIWTKLIGNVTLPGMTVLDPFMGSGTTGVACVKTGRNFIGIEIDPDYYAIAEKRIAEAQMQPRLEGI